VAFCARLVDEESGEGAPAEGDEHEERADAELPHPRLRLLADRDSPPDAEAPDSECEVESGSQDSDGVEDKHEAAEHLQLLLHRGVFDHGGRVDHVFVHRGREHVIDEEKEDDHSRPALQGVVAVLTPLGIGRIHVGKPAIDDEKTVDGVEEDRQNEAEDFDAEQKVLGPLLEEADDAVEGGGRGEGEGVEGQVLDHV